MINQELINDMVGYSLLPYFKGKQTEQHTFLFFEHENRCAVRRGDWKIIGDYGSFNWELYNIKEDRNELNNLAAVYPEIVAQMAEEWRKWALHYKIVPKGDSEGRGYKSPKK